MPPRPKFLHPLPLPLLRSLQGQGLTEYLILLILVSVISIAAVKSLGGTVKRKIETATRRINEDVSIEASR